jgi:transcription antitermination protein NusB
MSRTRVETRARARALQAMYAWDLRPGAKLEQVATQIWDDLVVEPAEREIAGGLIRTYSARRDRIDAALADVTTNWRLDRLGVIDRCVLRMAAAELERGETPAKVVIQEAVTIAERYAGIRSAKFVNGVLDALARRMGRLGEDVV